MGVNESFHLVLSLKTEQKLVGCTHVVKNVNLHMTENTQKKNADKKRYVASEWYYANVEKKAVYDKEYRNNNKERKRVNSRQWYANNLDRARLQAKNAGQRRKARKRANGVFYILPKHLTKLYSSKCIYCGSSENIQADHVIPVSRGGVHGIGNLVSACASCNLSKRDKTIMEWRLWKIKI